MIPKGKQLLYTVSQTAGWKQGGLFQKCKCLSRGTPGIRTVHGPRERTQFRKGIGICITQRNNVSAKLMASNTLPRKDHTCIDGKFNPHHKETHRRVEPDLFVEQKKSSCLIKVLQIHLYGENTGKSCAISNSKSEMHRPSPLASYVQD